MKLRILIYALFILAFLILSGFWYINNYSETQRRSITLAIVEKQTLEKKVSELYTSRKTLESEIASITNEKNDLAAKITQYESRMKEADAEITRLKTAVLDIEKLKLEMAAKDAELVKKSTELDVLKQGIEGYEREILVLNKKLAETAELLNSQKTEKGVSLEPITMTSKPKKEDARVLEVNTDYGFIVVDVGMANGVNKDDVLFIFRNDQMLGKVVVERSEEKISVAKILYKSLASNVKKGDFVSY